MDFLLGLQEALAHGISKDEYTEIWKKETDLKLSSSRIQNIASEGVTPMNMKSDELCAEKNPVIPLLKQIAEKQDMVQQQQIKIQQQLNHLHTLHGREQQKFEARQKDLSDKVLALEASLGNLQQTFAECLRSTVLSESLDIQEKLSLMTETLYNHMLEEMRNATAAGVSKTVNNAGRSIEVVVDAEPQMSEENADKYTASGYDKSHHNNASSDFSVNTVNNKNSDGKTKIPQLETHTDTTSVRNVSSRSDNENSNALKDTLHYELNTFLVNVQKLLLKPINSEDVSYHIIERLKELLQFEKNLTSEQLLNVQTALSSDVQARLYKVEMSFKNEISKIVSILELNEQSNLQTNMVLEEIEKIKSFLSSELPSRIVSHPKWASVFQKRNYVDVGSEVLYETGAKTTVRSDYPQGQDESSLIDQIERNKHGYTDGDDDTQVSPQTSSSEQVQTIILTLSMYVLMFLTGYDTKASDRTRETSQPRETIDSPLYSDVTGEHMNSKTHKKKQKREPQEKAIPKNLTDDHLKLIFGEHKEANFLCDLNYSTLSPDEEVCFQLKDIAPGYNLQLKAQISENKNVNFFIQAISGKLDDKLLWPAVFNMTITLVNKQPLAGTRPKHWQSFTKSKSLFKPIKSTGQSTSTPVCYFRNDIADSLVYDDTLTFKISVSHVNREEDTQE